MKMTYHIVQVTTENEIKAISRPGIELDLDELHTLCGGYIEVVHPMLLANVNPHILMLVDEDGKFKDKPVNLLGTALYGNPHDVIVGDIVLCTDFNLDPLADPDIYAFNEFDFNQIMSWIPRLLEHLKTL